MVGGCGYVRVARQAERPSRSRGWGIFPAEFGEPYQIRHRPKIQMATDQAGFRGKSGNSSSFAAR